MATTTLSPAISRVAPHNIEAEEAILGGILLDPEAIGRILDILRPEFFYSLAHQTIYRVMVQLHRQGSAIDLMTVTTALGDRDLLDAIGGQTKIAMLVEKTISAANIDQYATLVADKFTRRQLIAASLENIELGYQTRLPLPEVLNAAEQRIFGLTQHQPQSDMVSLADSLMESFEYLEALAEGTIAPGIPTDFYDLDDMTGGLHRSDLVIIAGRPAMGKSSLALGMAYSIAARGLPVCVFSMEMKRRQITDRLLSIEANIPSDKFRTGRLSDLDWQKVVAALEPSSKKPIFINDTFDLSVNDIQSKSRRIQAENGGKLGMILVDYLQLIGGSANNRVQELSQITRGFKKLARELDVPVVVLSQLSRGVETRTDKRPTLSDLRESGSIEQDADIVLMMYRDEYYNPGTPSPGIAEIIVTKHRNGPTGTVKLLFQSEFTRFANLAKR